MLRPTLNSPQTPDRMPVFLPGGISVAEADARYLRKNSVQVNATDFLALGAAPPASGAVRVDAASYGGTIVNGVNGGVSVGLFANHATLHHGVGSYSGNSFSLIANNIRKWNVVAEAAGVASIQSMEATARIIGGPTNGISFRNSPSTRDNCVIKDDGSQLVLQDAVKSASIALRSATGELTSGMWMYGGDGSSPADTWLCANGNTTAGRIAGIGYYDSSAASQWRSGAEVASANGFSTLKLMRGGGSVVIGTDPGGSAPWRVGGDAKIGGALILGNAYVAGAPAATGYVTLKDSTGTTYKLLCAA